MSELEQDKIVLYVSGSMILLLVFATLVTLWLNERNESKVYRAKYEDAWRSYVKATTK